MMKNDDLENELRNLKFTHLTEREMLAYCDQELDQVRRARIEAHLKQCFICNRYLTLLREENAALIDYQVTAEDIALVERLMEQMDKKIESSSAKPAETESSIPLREPFAEYLRQMVANWQDCFMQQSVRSVADKSEEVWQWRSSDALLQARAILEKNADLTIHFSSNEIGLDGAHLNVRLGPFHQETTLHKVSESEVYAKITVPRRQRPRNMADLSIDSV